MSYRRKSESSIEAYTYSGTSATPGWPVNWLTASHTFSPDQKIVYIQKNGETVEAKQGDFILLLKERFFVCNPAKFNKEFEAV